MGLKRNVAEAVGRTLGFSIARSGSESARVEEDFVRALLERLAIDCVFDVGANVGQYGRYLRDLGYAGRILSFEPGPQMVAALRQASAGDPLWDVFPIALGEERGALPLNIMKLDAMSSFLPPEVQQSEVYARLNVVDHVVEVEVSTLAVLFDDLQTRYGFSRPFLKLDTQGYDLRVAQGASDKLARFCAIQSEMAVRRLYAGCPHMTESLATFDGMGFDLIGIHKVHPEELLDPHEFNCYLLRRGLAPGVTDNRASHG